MPCLKTNASNSAISRSRNASRASGTSRSRSTTTRFMRRARCLHCGTPFCSNNCPVHNRPVDWNRLVREGDWERAWACLSATNSFPEFTSPGLSRDLRGGLHEVPSRRRGRRHPLDRARRHRPRLARGLGEARACGREDRKACGRRGVGPLRALPAPSSLPVRATTSRSTRSPSAPRSSSLRHSGLQAREGRRRAPHQPA